MARLLTLLFFTLFLLKFFFVKNLILPAERRGFLKNKKHNKKTIKKDGQVIDLCWPGYWPYSIYICVYIYISLSLLSLQISLCCVHKHYECGPEINPHGTCFAAGGLTMQCLEIRAFIGAINTLLVCSCSTSSSFNLHIRSNNICMLEQTECWMKTYKLCLSVAAKAATGKQNQFAEMLAPTWTLRLCWEHNIFSNSLVST